MISSDWDVPEASSKHYKPEPILAENASRFVLFPIQYHKIWQAYKNSEAKFWSAEEIELAEDLYSFQKLSGKEKAFVVQAYSILTSTDKMLQGKSVFTPFGTEIQIPEGRCFFGFQMMQENIHKELYNLFLQLFGEKFFAENDEQEQVIQDTVNEFSSVTRKLAWVQQYILDSDDHFSVKTCALAVYQYVFGCSVDVVLLLLAKIEEKSTKNVIASTRYHTEFPGIIKSTARIMYNKASNLEFVQALHQTMVNKPETAQVIKIVNSAVDIEKDLVSEFLACAGGNLVINQHAVQETKLHAFIEFRANQVLNAIGLSPVYAKTNHELDDVLAVYEIETFEEKSSLQKASPAADTQKTKQEAESFTLDAEF